MADLSAHDLYEPDAAEAPLLSLADVSILKAAPLTRLSFRCRPAALPDAGAAFGATLPTTPLTAEMAAARAALWLGPDEWTLLAPEGEADAIAATMSEKLAAHPHSLVDISDRSEAILVNGPKAAWLLNTGIFMDFSTASFPVGRVTRTIFNKAPVMVWRTGPETFVIEAWVSFMPYVSGLLVQSAEELAAA